LDWLCWYTASTYSSYDSDLLLEEFEPVVNLFTRTPLPNGQDVKQECILSQFHVELIYIIPQMMIAFSWQLGFFSDEAYH